MIKLERVQSAPARSLVLDVRAPERREHGTPLFETLRIVELRLLRMGLARKLSSSPRWVEADPERARRAAEVADLIGKLGAPPQGLLPEVVVVSRSGEGPIERVFSVVNGAVFLSAGRSGDWREGREDAVFLEVLRDALRIVRDERLLQSGARVIAGPLRTAIIDPS